MRLELGLRLRSRSRPDGCGGGWLEAEIDVEDVHEATQKKACADSRYAGESDLGDDEGGAKTLVLSAVAHAGAGVFEGFLQIVGGGHFDAGEKAEEDWRSLTVMRRVHASAGRRCGG